MHKCQLEAENNEKLHFSKKGLGEIFCIVGFLEAHMGYWARVIVIPQVHFKSIQTQFRLPVVHLNSKWQAQA